jgi:predicted RNase H-like HicB family nuclease
VQGLILCRILNVRVTVIIRSGNQGDNSGMVTSYTAKYTKISSGYMGQLVEWPEVITEGRDIDECREMLKDAVGEMILAYRQQKREIPFNLH